MDKTFREGKPRGEKTHFHPIDSLGNFTWKKGFMYCITGNPGSGKSEFVGHLTMLKSYFDGWKWAVYSPESYPVEDYTDTLVHGFVGKSTDPGYYNQMSKTEYDKGFQFIYDHFRVADFDEMPNLDDIEHMISEAKDCDGVIIDPFNSLDTSSTEMMSENLKMSLTRLRNLGRKHNKALVLIEHPKTNSIPLDENDMPKEPTEYNLYGGSMWNNKCDVIGVVHRPFIREKDNTLAQFRTTKIKNQKLNGYPDLCAFNFDRKTNRYTWRLTENGLPVDAFTGLKKLEEIPYEGYDHQAGF